MWKRSQLPLKFFSALFNALIHWPANTSHRCPQDKVTRSRQRQTVGTGKGGGCQGWWRASTADVALWQLCYVRALEGLAGCCFGRKGLGQWYSCWFCKMERGDLLLSAGTVAFSMSFQPSWWQQRHPTQFSRTLSSDHWSSPLLLLILRQLLPWHKQLGPDNFPAPQSLENRWLWKNWWVTLFHAP